MFLHIVISMMMTIPMQARERKLLCFRGKFWSLLMLLCRLCQSGWVVIIFVTIVINGVVVVVTIVIVITFVISTLSSHDS